MKSPTSKFFNQHGFSLLESLIALLIFSMIVMGSGVAISRMLNVQKEMNLNSVILNMMQTRLQNASNSSTTTNICNSVDVSQFSLGGQPYYVGCSTDTIGSGTGMIAWPILAVSAKSQVIATGCASGTSHISCYIVGR